MTWTNRINPFDRTYHNLLQEVLTLGQKSQSRAKLSDGSQPHTLSVFGDMRRYDLSKGFPLITSKKLGTKGFVTELLWFLRGDTNIKFLHEHNCHIWDQWANVTGDLGPIYGGQWRNFNGVDQIKELESSLRNDPFSRRHILNAWNVGQLKDMALPPCHLLCQFKVTESESGLILNSILYQRSADLFLGVPWNIASYALLTSMFASVLGYRVGTFTHMIGDAHIYFNHIDQVVEQTTRTSFAPPTLKLNPFIKSVVDFTHEDIHIVGYKSHGTLKGEVAV